jgi:hypothetical protein
MKVPGRFKPRVCLSAAIASGAMLLLQLLAGSAADTLFTIPIIVISPPVLDFGTVATNKTVTNTFLVENAGGGKLIGKAAVEPPFRILSGEAYALRHNEAQVVTVVYKPTGASTNMGTVKFTGGNGARATVVGRPARGR